MTEFTLSFTQEIATQALFIVIVLDFLTGTARAVHERKLNSTVGLNGVLKHTIIVITIFLLGYITNAAGTPWFGNAVTIAFAYHNINSVFENWRLAGHEIPLYIENALDKLPYQELRDDNAAELIEHDKNDTDKLAKLGKSLVTSKNNKQQGGQTK